MRWLNYIIILVSLIVCHYPFCLLLCLFESHLWDIIPITIVPVLGSVERQERSSWCLVRPGALVAQAVQWGWREWKGCWALGCCAAWSSISALAARGISWSSELCSGSSSSGLHPGTGKSSCCNDCHNHLMRVCEGYLSIINAGIWEMY